MGKQLEVSKETWDKEFESGRWDCLEDNPAERARHAIISMFARHYFPKGRILDVGCGSGTLIDYLDDKQREKYVGIDISREAIRIGKRRRRGSDLRCLSAEAFEDGKKFDVIVFNEMLYYVDDTDVLERYASLLRDDGIIIVSVYHIKSERHDRQIIRTIRKYFKFCEAIEVAGEAGGQKVTWRVGVSKHKDRPI